MDDVDAQIIADRNRDIQQLDRDMEDLAEVYQVHTVVICVCWFFTFVLFVCLLCLGSESDGESAGRADRRCRGQRHDFRIKRISGQRTLGHFRKGYSLFLFCLVYSHFMFFCCLVDEFVSKEGAYFDYYHCCRDCCDCWSGCWLLLLQTTGVLNMRKTEQKPILESKFFFFPIKQTKTAQLLLLPSSGTRTDTKSPSVVASKLYPAVGHTIFEEQNVWNKTNNPKKPHLFRFSQIHLELLLQSPIVC
jgi:hypothetical protein